MAIRLNPHGHRSLNANESSLVRFRNTSGSGSFVIWYDYRGRRVLYCLLNSGQVIDMNTYVTHPWIFEKSTTGDRLNANLVPTYYPMKNSDGRHVVNITYPMYTLKERSLQVVRDSYRINNDYDLMELELPKPLDSELRFLLTKKYCAQIHNRESETEAGNAGVNNPAVAEHSCSFHSVQVSQFGRFRRN